jgi:hypothetical protein
MKIIIHYHPKYLEWTCPSFNLDKNHLSQLGANSKYLLTEYSAVHDQAYIDVPADLGMH